MTAEDLQPEHAQPEHARPDVVVLERTRPTPGRDAGSQAVVDLVRTLADAGHLVELVALDEVPDRGALLDRLNRDDLIVVASRPEVGVLTASPRLDRPFKIFLGHDLHHRRLQRWRQTALQAADAVRADAAMRPAAAVPDAATIERVRRLEMRCWLGHDVSLYPDPAEVEFINGEIGQERARWFPYFVVEPQPVAPSRAATGRRSLLFIGGCDHAPNRDAVRAFVGEVLPALAAACARTAAAPPRLHVVGAWSAEARAEFEGRAGRGRAAEGRAFEGHASEGPALQGRAEVEFHGVLDDDALQSLARRQHLAVAPLRFGAGVKRKVLHYLQLGLPVLATPVAVEGLPGPLPEAQLRVLELIDWPEHLTAPAEPAPIGSPHDTNGPDDPRHTIAPTIDGVRYLHRHFSKSGLYSAWRGITDPSGTGTTIAPEYSADHEHEHAPPAHQRARRHG